jgi:hypothetical protein
MDGKRVSDLCLLAGRFAICRLPADDAVPAWAAGGPFSSITRTSDELSIVCAEGLAPAGSPGEGGWRVFQVAGPLDFSLTGILAAIASPLAKAGVSIFAVSTFLTDYILVKEENLASAVEALRTAGHSVVGASPRSARGSGK